jgi:hypothetical protein
MATTYRRRRAGARPETGSAGADAIGENRARTAGDQVRVPIVTGWQGNEGGYPGGGWNPQQDPYGGQYGGAPGQQGGTPNPHGGAPDQQYGAPGQYGADPYGQYPQTGAQYPQTSAYPAYQTGFGYGPPEPPKRSKLPIILSVVAIVAVVGAVVTIVVLNRDSGSTPTAGGGTSSSRPAPTTRSAPPSSRKSPPSSKPNTKDGWTAIPVPGGGGYQVPEDWKLDPRPADSGLGVNFIRGALVGPYDCGGSNYFRGFTATGEVQGKAGAELDLNKTVTDFANSFANTYYRSPKLETPAPKEATVDGEKGATLTVKLTVTPGKPECDATSGEVAVVGVPIERSGKVVAIRMLVVVNDLAGGPATPPGLPDPLAEEILTTFTLK